MEAPTPSQCVGITIHGYSLPLEGAISVIVAIKIAIFGLETSFGPRRIQKNGFHFCIVIIKYIVFFEMITLPSLAAGHPRVVAFVYLRGILASVHLNQADAMLTKIEDAARVEVDYDYVYMPERHPTTPDDEFLPEHSADYDSDDEDDVEMDPAPPRSVLRCREDVNQGSSSDAPDSQPAGVKSESKHTYEWEGEPDYGDVSRPTRTYAAEWHSGKRITMKCLKMNMYIYRADKRTHYLCSALHMRLFYATVLSVRRKAMEEYMDLTSLDAARVYVPKDFQNCIRHAVELWWQTSIATEESSGWQNFLKLGCKGDRKLAERSYYRNWKHEIFGKDWIFDFFIAFGDLDVGMLDALNEACEYRAIEADKKAAKKADPASTRNTTSLDRLSARGRAAAMGFPVPDVEGMTRTISLAAWARHDAREVEEEVRTFEKLDLEIFKETNVWTPAMAKTWNERRALADMEWENAHKLSLAAGHNFIDRYGKWQTSAP